MPLVRSKVSIVAYSNKGYVLEHQLFETQWPLQSACHAKNPKFFASLVDTLSKTSFPVNRDMQVAFEGALGAFRDTETLVKLDKPLFDSVQLTPALSCNVGEHFRRVLDGTCLEACNGSLVATYSTETSATGANGMETAGMTINAEKSEKSEKSETSETSEKAETLMTSTKLCKQRQLETSLPTQCITWTSKDGSALLINSWTYPEYNIQKYMRGSMMNPSRISLPAFSQHFLVTDGTTFCQKPCRHVVHLRNLYKTNKTINRNILKLEQNNTAQSHKDTRILSKTEHTAIRHACGFSDNAWQHAVLTANRHFSAWSTAHTGNDVFVVSLFLH